MILSLRILTSPAGQRSWKKDPHFRKSPVLQDFHLLFVSLRNS